MCQAVDDDDGDSGTRVQTATVWSHDDCTLNNVYLNYENFLACQAMDEDGDIRRMQNKPLLCSF